MDYEKFKEQFTRDVKGKLYAKGIEVNINVNRVNKVNESYAMPTLQDKIGSRNSRALFLLASFSSTF